ncbi:hypothetical protein P3X46_012222 [Hevea brasiliensis]|uniref:Clavata3/ESR (CLE) gene family member n=1 Tax=Hevea brasiliensis TaxID=3981 RepID=A0ABQ9MDF2_HEVBR|nr:hypothetical protein P3X46_012222 [Hevea brasiliensis]
MLIYQTLNRKSEVLQLMSAYNLPQGSAFLYQLHPVRPSWLLSFCLSDPFQIYSLCLVLLNSGFCLFLQNFLEYKVLLLVEMRLAVLVIAVLCCLLIFACIGSDAVQKKAFLFHIHGAKKKNNTLSNRSLEAVNKYFSMKGKKNNNTLDEKRIVPTGSNPLHNR